MTVSQMTITDIKNYLRLSETTTADDNLLTSMLESAKAYIKKYTGLADEGLDSEPDFVIVVYVLCQDAWDNRSYYVDSSNVNKVVENILGLHSVNLL